MTRPASTPTIPGIVGSAVLSLAMGCGGATPEPTAAMSVEAVPNGAASSPSSLQQAGVAERPQVRTVPFRVADLPSLEVHDLSGMVAPAIDRGSPPRDLTIERSGSGAILRTQPVPGEIGMLELGGVRSTWRGGLKVGCGEKKDAPLAIKKLQILADGTAVYSEVAAWFHAATCTASEVERRAIRPTPLMSGYLFAYRSCAAPCGPSGDAKVVFLTPPLTGGRVAENGLERAVVAQPFGFASVVVKQGGTSTFEGAVSNGTLRELFHDSPPYGGPAGGAVVVGAQISQDTTEMEPTAIGYGSRDPTRSDSAPPPTPAAQASMQIEFDE